MSQSEYETPKYKTVEVPGFGEIKARRGTSTVELAGAVKVWHDKAMSGRIDGFISGAATVFMLDLLIAGLYFYFRN